MSNILNNTAKNPGRRSNGGRTKDVIPDKTAENVLPFSSFYSPHKAIPPVVEQVQKVESVEKSTLLDISDYDNNKNDPMEVENQFYMAAAEVAKHIGVDKKVLVEALRKVVQGRFLISLVTESPTTVGSGAATDQSTVGVMAKSGFLANDSWIHALTVREQKLLEPRVMESVEKLLKLKGKVTYSTERGPRAQGPYGWIQKTLVEPSGPLTKYELELIPQWVYLRFDKKLYQALQDAKQRAKKRELSK